MSKKFILHDMTTEESKQLVEDRRIKKAMWFLDKHKIIDPLIREFEQGNAGIFRNSDAKSALKKRLKGDLVTGSGNTSKLLDRNYYMCRAIYHLNRAGLPIKSESNDVEKTTACLMVGDRFGGKSQDTAYKVWTSRTKEWRLESIVDKAFDFMIWKSDKEIVDYFYYMYTGEINIYFEKYPTDDEG